MAVSSKEQTESWLRWRAYIKDLSGDGKVTTSELHYLEILFCKKDIIGCGKGLIRPGERGKLDVFRFLRYCCELSRRAKLDLAGLTELDLKNLNQKSRESRRKRKRSKN